MSALLIFIQLVITIPEYSVQLTLPDSTKIDTSSTDPLVLAKISQHDHRKAQTTITYQDTVFMSKVTFDHFIADLEKDYKNFKLINVSHGTIDGIKAIEFDATCTIQDLKIFIHHISFKIGKNVYASAGVSLLKDSIQSKQFFYGIISSFKQIE